VDTLEDQRWTISADPKPAEMHNTFMDLEWLQRERLSKGMAAQLTDDSAQWTRVSGDAVLKRNRYFNVDPFEHNRVRLRVPEGHSDYINASPIRLASLRAGGADKYFIATQGPKEDGVAHIWRMLWHECGSPAVIVMLTQTHEAGREKCFPYFPADLDAPTLELSGAADAEFADGLFASVALAAVRWDPATRCTVREMDLVAASGEARRVVHFLFAGWPDFLVPEGDDKAALVALVRESARVNTAEGSPRIVHCSAGVGRSGTFIALDWLLGELEEGNLDEPGEVVDPVAEVVDRLRKQRVMMVQGEAQFLLLYDALREQWIERWKRRQENGATAELS